MGRGAVVADESLQSHPGPPEGVRSVEIHGELELGVVGQVVLRVASEESRVGVGGTSKLSCPGEHEPNLPCGPRGLVAFWVGDEQGLKPLSRLDVALGISHQ